MSMSWLDLGDGVPGVLAVARRAHVLAERVRVAARLVRAAADGDAAWQGPAAVAARSAQVDVAARLDRCAAQLDDVAAAAMTHARTAGDRADELEALARRAMDLLTDVTRAS